MGSSNRHWPSLFKSKPHHHDFNSSLVSSASRVGVSPYSSSGCEERSPEPKPRWNPKPEQIRILEAIFNSGMVNPPRDEIRKIRAQLQQYGEVGDANVFYWFQNRKSRSKHKHRHLQQLKAQATASQPPQNPSPISSTPAASSSNINIVAAASSSSSSDKSSSRGSDHVKTTLLIKRPHSDHVSNINSPTASVNQTYFQTPPPNDFIQDQPFFFPFLQQPAADCGGGAASADTGFGTKQLGLCLGDLIGNGTTVVHHHAPSHDQTTVMGFSNLLLGEMIGVGEPKRVDDDDEMEKLKFHQEFSFFVTNPTPTDTIAAAAAAAPPTSASLSPFQGDDQSDVGRAHAAGKSTVFINDVAFEVPIGVPLNVREAFGDDALLVHPSGYPVLTNDWGLTLQPLQNGAFYYLIRTFAAPSSSAPATTAQNDIDELLLASHFPYQI
ncbi:hypothetical protein Dimus_035233 [Dionaea muscipula]